MSDRITSGYMTSDINRRSARFIATDRQSELIRNYSRDAPCAVNSSAVTSARSFLSYNNYRTPNNKKKNSSFDWLTDSETGTPDFQSPDSDSSTGSLLSRSDAAAAKKLAEEWDKLERTLYNEEGSKVTQQHLIEECNQWRELFPHLRVIGRRLILNNIPHSYESDDDIIIEDLTDNPINIDQCFPNRHSSSASSNREWNNNVESYSIIDIGNKDDSLRKHGTKKPITGDNITKMIDYKQLDLSLHSLLRITPLKSNLLSRDVFNSDHCSSILRSEISSSRWCRNNDTNTSLPIIMQENNHFSAKPILNADKPIKNNVVSQSAGESRSVQWKRPPNTAVYKNPNTNKLLPINIPTIEKAVPRQYGKVYGKTNRKVYLPPISNINRKKYDSTSILRVYENDERKPRNRFSYTNKSIERY